MSQESDFLSIEEPLAIEVNKQRVAVLMRLPGDEKELAAGFLLSEGYITDFNDIMTISHCGSLMPGEVSDDPLTPSRNIVRIKAEHLLHADDSVTLLIRSGCGRTGVDEIAEELPRLDSSLLVDISVITGMSKTILDLQEVRKLAGGVHLAALFTAEGQLICSYEDIGRHNAADKAIGYALLRQISLEDKILYITGRASYEMVNKAARMQIPILASKSSPTSLAVEYAQEANLTLCGFVRPNRANIYSAEKRIGGTE
jgi:FdhD protein